MEKKVYKHPFIRVINAAPESEMLAGSMWTEDAFTRKQEFEEEEVEESETPSRFGFWG